MPDYEPGLYFVLDVRDGQLAVVERVRHSWYTIGTSAVLPDSAVVVLSGPYTAAELLALVQETGLRRLPTGLALDGVPLHEDPVMTERRANLPPQVVPEYEEMTKGVKGVSKE